MNLAFRDIRYNLGRFVFTAAGLGLLLMIVMGMTGIYNGLIEDATGLVDKIGADLWVVQRDTRGPFAEISRVPRSLEDRLLAVPGVARSRAFVSHTLQRQHQGKPLRIVVQGLSWPQDKGDWLPLVAGRSLRAAHYEMIADRSLGLRLGQTLPLGKDVFTVVGLTQSMLGNAGDGMAFFSLLDSQAIQFDQPGEAIRLARAVQAGQRGSAVPPARVDSTGQADQPISAVLVDLKSGVNPQEVIQTLSGWADVTVHTSQQQRDLLLMGMINKSRKQLWLFRVILVIVSAIIMALILYTLTLDKIHDIAVLKLMGSRNRVIVGMIMQQAILLGMLGYTAGHFVGQFVFPYFPRRVSLTGPDMFVIAGVVLGIAVLASLVGIRKAIKVEPNTVLA
jgi:putative ABC transport system permease protein